MVVKTSKKQLFGYLCITFNGDNSMRIIEQKVIGKKDQTTCEDGIIVTDSFAAVIDGSTSKTPLRINPAMTNGQYCMEAVRQHIEELSTDATAEDFCVSVTQKIMSIYEARNIDISILRQHPEERMTASAVIYTRTLRQLWFIGDCQCLINGTVYNNSKPQEAILAARRAAFLSDAISKGNVTTEEIIGGHDAGRELILNDLIESCKGQNIDFSVIDGFPIPMQHVRIINVPEDTEELVLASDGYPILRPSLSESEDALHVLLSKDPLCINLFKATKGLVKGNNSFDDRSYLRIKI